jgi:hypothetical protein
MNLILHIIQSSQEVTKPVLHFTSLHFTVSICESCCTPSGSVCVPLCSKCTPMAHHILCDTSWIVCVVMVVKACYTALHNLWLLPVIVAILVCSHLSLHIGPQGGFQCCKVRNMWFAGWWCVRCWTTAIPSVQKLFIQNVTCNEGKICRYSTMLQACILHESSVSMLWY